MSKVGLLLIAIGVFSLFLLFETGEVMVLPILWIGMFPIVMSLRDQLRAHQFKT